MNNQGNTGTAKIPAPEKTPGRTEQNPGTSRGQQQNWTGTSEERSQYEQKDRLSKTGSAFSVDNAVTDLLVNDDANADLKIRNPSGDDLSNAVRGDEGPGRRNP